MEYALNQAGWFFLSSSPLAGVIGPFRTSVKPYGNVTARGGQRLDCTGGVEGNMFFMRNGGFFSERVGLDQTFARPANPAGKPQIDVGSLDPR